MKCGSTVLHGLHQVAPNLNIINPTFSIYTNNSLSGIVNYNLTTKVLYNYKNELNIDSYQIKRNKEKPESIIIYTINNDNYITIYFDGDNNLIRGGRAVVAGFYPIFYETVYELKIAINICLDHLVNTPDNY